MCFDAEMNRRLSKGYLETSTSLFEDNTKW